MRYAIFSDIHANLEALEAVLAKIDELAQEEPIEQIWFLGDLVGYGPDPNECILKLCERTDVIIAGNHDWAAVGKIDLEDFSAAARISAEWTAEQLTEEHRTFLTDLPERVEIGECTLVHGSPYGPLWEYLTSEVLAERSFQYFSSRYCLVGHTHVPVIFQQPDALSTAPTLPLHSNEPTKAFQRSNGIEHQKDEDEEETEEMVAVQTPMQQSTHSATVNGTADSAFKEPERANQIEVEEYATLPTETATEPQKTNLVTFEGSDTDHDNIGVPVQVENGSTPESEEAIVDEVNDGESITKQQDEDTHDEDANEQIITARSEDFDQDVAVPNALEETESENSLESDNEEQATHEISLEPVAIDSEDQLSGEIEELLTLLGLSQSMIQVTNEMITPPEGLWEADEGYRAIINPGGVGQPRDGDPRAAFMIYDTEHGFEFYRVPYAFEKTQEKIIKAGLPQYLAVRLEYGR
jgi:diadenosine tetraphosphatase ApaH/serine/threonine PP2A family protein phosphatase